MLSGSSWLFRGLCLISGRVRVGLCWGWIPTVLAGGSGFVPGTEGTEVLRLGVCYWLLVEKEVGCLLLAVFFTAN